MGQKVNPHGLRVGIINGWDTQWYADKKNFGLYLAEDNEIRKALKKKYYAAAVSKILIERAANTLTVDMYCGRPGVAIGKDASRISEIKKTVTDIVSKETAVNINVLEVKKIDIDAQLAAESIAANLEKRMHVRKSMRQVMSKAMKSGAKGIKTMVSGRLNGAEIARSERYSEGSIPLQTLRANIDYGFAEARTTYGIIGVKVWIYKGEVFSKLGKGGDAQC